ncbi:HEAT repeat domain-containing protein [Streptomyces sp. NPDC051286]|uniref:HEAT repeat domain-containing protein n=1 Tax=Streptomyces sp. NPDC051286 TaxID=3365647 RepID=UPI0037993A9D
MRERRPHPLDGPAPAALVLLRQIAAAGDPGEATKLCETLHWFGPRRRGSVDQLAHLAGHPDPQVRVALVEAVAGWSTPGVQELLHRLGQDPHPDVREAVELTRPDQP